MYIVLRHIYVLVLPRQFHLFQLFISFKFLILHFFKWLFLWVKHQKSLKYISCVLKDWKTKEEENKKHTIRFFTGSIVNGHRLYYGLFIIKFRWISTMSRNRLEQNLAQYIYLVILRVLLCQTGTKMYCVVLMTKSLKVSISKF